MQGALKQAESELISSKGDAEDHRSRASHLQRTVAAQQVGPVGVCCTADTLFPSNFLRCGKLCWAGWAEDACQPSAGSALCLIRRWALLLAAARQVSCLQHPKCAEHRRAGVPATGHACFHRRLLLVTGLHVTECATPRLAAVSATDQMFQLRCPGLKALTACSLRAKTQPPPPPPPPPPPLPAAFAVQG